MQTAFQNIGVACPLEFLSHAHGLKVHTEDRGNRCMLASVMGEAVDLIEDGVYLDLVIAGDV